MTTTENAAWCMPVAFAGGATASGVGRMARRSWQWSQVRKLTSGVRTATCIPSTATYQSMSASGWAVLRTMWAYSVGRKPPWCSGTWALGVVVMWWPGCRSPTGRQLRVDVASAASSPRQATWRSGRTSGRAEVRHDERSEAPSTEGRLRQDPGGRRSLDQQRADPSLPERQRRGQPDGPGADDDDLTVPRRCRSSRRPARRRPCCAAHRRRRPRPRWCRRPVTSCQ